MEDGVRRRQVVLITGCSSGIGLSLAVGLASDPDKRYKVYATLRTLDNKRRLLESVRGFLGDTLDILQMDVTDPASIRSAQDRVQERHLDILVCNAGVGLMGPLEVQDSQVMKRVMEVNLFGTLNTLQAFLPDMKSRRQGHILVTGSTGGLQGLPFNEVYCASKFAVEGVCESLAVVLHNFHIHVSIIECGSVNTDFMLNVKKTKVGDGSLDALDPQTLSLYQRFLRHCGVVFQNAAQDTEDIVKVFMDAIRSPEPALRYYTRGIVPPLVKLKTAEPDGLEYIREMNKLIFSQDDEELPP